MIRVLAQIIARQVLPRREGIREEPDPLLPHSQQVEQTPAAARTRSSVRASTRGAQTLAAGHWPEPPAQTLVVLFTELAQRRVQALRKPGGDS